MCFSVPRTFFFFRTHHKSLVEDGKITVKIILGKNVSVKSKDNVTNLLLHKDTCKAMKKKTKFPRSHIGLQRTTKNMYNDGRTDKEKQATTGKKKARKVLPAQSISNIKATRN